MRKGSTRAKVEQELVTIGKLEERLGVKDGKTVFKPTVMGTYFGASQTFTMYKHGETATPDYADIDKQIEAHGDARDARTASSSPRTARVKSSTTGWTPTPARQGGTRRRRRRLRQDERGRGPRRVRRCSTSSTPGLPEEGPAARRLMARPGQRLPAPSRLHGKARRPWAPAKAAAPQVTVVAGLRARRPARAARPRSRGVAARFRRRGVRTSATRGSMASTGCTTPRTSPATSSSAATSR